MKAKKTFGIVLSALILASFLTACNKDKPADTTPAPTAQTTEAAVTVQPTTEITEAPASVQPTEEATEAALTENGYNEHDYKLVCDFLDLVDENGESNWQKCFGDYRPTSGESWGDGKNNIWFNWDTEGYLTAMTGDDERTIGAVRGDLIIKEMSHLELFRPSFTEINSVTIADCPALKDISYCNNKTEKFNYSAHSPIEYLYAGGEMDLVPAGSYFDSTLKEFHWECDGAATDEPEKNSFTFDIKAEGNGRISILSVLVDEAYNIKLEAFADENAAFVGWFDKDGKLVSDNAKLEFEPMAQISGEFIYTAKFE